MIAGPIPAGLLLLLLALLTACTARDEPVVAGPTAPSTAAPSAPTAPIAPPTAPPSVDCPQDPVDAAVCRYISAVQADDVSALSPGEQEVAATAEDDLPAGEWTAQCELVGDVTVLCEVVFEGTSQRRGLRVAPVNAVYDDGRLITTDLEAVRYEVTEDLGTGAAGSFD